MFFSLFLSIFWLLKTWKKRKNSWFFFIFFWKVQKRHFSLFLGENGGKTAFLGVPPPWTPLGIDGFWSVFGQNRPFFDQKIMFFGVRKVTFYEKCEIAKHPFWDRVFSCFFVKNRWKTTLFRLFLTLLENVGNL